jgi:hypothetical protein
VTRRTPFTLWRSATSPFNLDSYCGARPKKTAPLAGSISTFTGLVEPRGTSPQFVLSPVPALLVCPINLKPGARRVLLIFFGNDFRLHCGRVGACIGL